MSGPRPAGVSAGRGLEWAAKLAPLSPRSLKVVWDISNKCNLRCRMCHFAFDDVFYRAAEYTTPEDFEAFAQRVLPYAHTLILSAGNEPMTSPWFADVLRIAGRFRVPSVLFITNATRMTPAIVDAIIETGVTQVQISIDGSTKETYESIRRGAVFEKVIANVAHLNARKKELGCSIPQLQFNIVLMRSNLQELEGFVTLAEQLGVEWIAARHMLVMKGLDVEAESLALDPELANKWFSKFLARAEASSVKVISFPDLFDIEAIRRNARERRIVDFERPFGVVDTPGEEPEPPNAEIVLSGWALDKISLVGVAIERDPWPDTDDAGDLNSRQLVPVADARLGIARGDVGALYPDFDASDRSGWTIRLDARTLGTAHALVVGLHVIAFSISGAISEIGFRRVTLLSPIPTGAPAHPPSIGN
jgi:MoaA/NifB/PqqE/SkfB family radical SAM enzyme